MVEVARVTVMVEYDDETATTLLYDGPGLVLGTDRYPLKFSVDGHRVRLWDRSDKEQVVSDGPAGLEINREEGDGRV